MENPIQKLWAMQKEMQKILKDVRPEHCNYPDAIEFLKDDVHKLRGRLMQVGAKGDYLMG